jgi:hypothetical protein
MSAKSPGCGSATEFRCRRRQAAGGAIRYQKYSQEIARVATVTGTPVREWRFQSILMPRRRVHHAHRNDQPQIRLQLSDNSLGRLCSRP